MKGLWETKALQLYVEQAASLFSLIKRKLRACAPKALGIFFLNPAQIYQCGKALFSS
jgi:hypothetical protein